MEQTTSTKRRMLVIVVSNPEALRCLVEHPAFRVEILDVRPDQLVASRRLNAQDGENRD